ncbi:MAG: hypothetical protein ACE5IJ_09255 [Thermoplasmata archaeon]
MGESALANSASLNLSLYDIVPILEGGEDCARSRRKANIVERCAAHGGRWIKVVAKHDVHTTFRIECWVIIHLDEAERP